MTAEVGGTAPGLPECVGCAPGRAPGTWAERNRRLAVLMSLAGVYFVLLAALHTLQPENYWFQYWYLFPIALGICITVCVFGIEGAILFVPFFAVAFPLFGGPLTPLQAVTIGLVTEVFGFSSTLSGYARAKLVDWKVGFRAIAWSVPLALAGGFVAFLIPGRALLAVVSAVLLVVAVALLRSPSEYALLRRETAGAAVPDGVPGAGELRSLTDAQERTYRYRYLHDGRRIGVVSAGGLLEGLVGFGVGVLGVAHLLVRRTPVRVAVGTSSLIVMATALAAVTPHVAEVTRNIGFAPWNILIMTIPAVLIGGQTAAVLAGRIDPDRLRRAFIGLMFVLSAVTGGRALG